MSRGDAAAAPFEVIAEALEEPAGRATFVRGLLVGTLVGAAVVGSLLHARQAARPHRDTPVEPVDPAGRVDIKREAPPA